MYQYKGGKIYKDGTTVPPGGQEWYEYQVWLSEGNKPEILADVMDLQTLQENRRSQLDHNAYVAACRYITNYPDRIATYMYKVKQVEDFELAGSPESELFGADGRPSAKYGAIAAEKLALSKSNPGITTAECCAVIKQQRDAWVGMILPAIEEARRTGKEDISVATTKEGVETAFATAWAKLEAI